MECAGKKQTPPWSDDEIKTFLAIWSQPSIKEDLQYFENKKIFRKMSDQMLRHGYHRDWSQCRTKVYSMKRDFKMFESSKNKLLPYSNITVGMESVKFLPELSKLLNSSTPSRSAIDDDTSTNLPIKLEMDDDNNIIIGSSDCSTASLLPVIAGACSIPNVNPVKDERDSPDIESAQQHGSPVRPASVSSSSSSPHVQNSERPESVPQPETNANPTNETVWEVIVRSVDRLTGAVERATDTQAQLHREKQASKRYERRRENGLKRKHEETMRAKEHEHQIKLMRLLLTGQVSPTAAASRCFAT